MDKEIQANQWWLDMWHERTSPLDPSSPNRFWGEGKRERKENRFLERESTFSLEFPVIGLSNPGEPRDKVAPHSKSYAWILVLWIFDKLREVEVFSYLVISCLKAMTMVLGVVRPGRATDFGSKKWNRYMMRGAVHGQPTD